MLPFMFTFQTSEIILIDSVLISWVGFKKVLLLRAISWTAYKKQ